MESLKQFAELGSEYLSVEIDKKNKEAFLTLEQKLARDVYEMKVAKPLRTILGYVFAPTKHAFEQHPNYANADDWALTKKKHS